MSSPSCLSGLSSLSRSCLSCPSRLSSPCGSEVLNLILLHVLTVLGERLREHVCAVISADEVQILGLGRMDHRIERGTARRGNGTGRQAGITVRVVRRVEGQSVPPDVAVVATR